MKKWFTTLTITRTESYKRKQHSGRIIACVSWNGTTYARGTSWRKEMAYCVNLSADRVWFTPLSSISFGKRICKQIEYLEENLQVDYMSLSFNFMLCFECSSSLIAYQKFLYFHFLVTYATLNSWTIFSIVFNAYNVSWTSRYNLDLVLSYIFQFFNCRL